MKKDPTGPRTKEDQPEVAGYPNPADQTPRREGGDDALAESSPTDSRSDEKVIVNTQREHKTVNQPSQTGVHSSETESDEDDVDAL